MRRGSSYPVAYFFEFVALAAAIGISWGILQDLRSKSVVALVLAPVIGLLAPLVRRWRPGLGSLGDLIAAGAIGACAAKTHPVGGLALLVPCFFLIVASVAGLYSERRTGAGRRRRIAARAILVVAPLLMLASLADPGMSRYIAFPVFLPLLLWAAFSLAGEPRRTSLNDSSDHS